MRKEPVLINSEEGRQADSQAGEGEGEGEGSGVRVAEAVIKVV